MVVTITVGPSTTLHARRKNYATEYTPLIHPLSKYGALEPNTHVPYRVVFLIVSILTMVAIPTYLLASSVLSSLHSFIPFKNNPITISPSSIAEAQVIPRTQADDDGPFSSLQGPLISTNFPDPAVIYHEGVSYAFATNNRKPPPDLIRIQMATSHDNKTWSLTDSYDALPNIAPWQTGRGVWAPDVVRLANGKFVLYYADNAVWAPAHHCVGAALSDSVTGPFVPLDKPLACPDPFTKGGAIDPDGFLDPATGKRYLIYKVDGNSLGHGGLCSNDVNPIVPTPIMLQEVSPDDGVTLIGDAVEILDRDAQDGPLIEAPSMHRSAEGIYFLFFSSNCFTTPLYDTSFATSENIAGPYVKSRRPLFVTGDGPDLVGPGGMDIIADGDLIVFHGHMTMQNDAAQKALVEKTAKAANKPIQDIHLPLVRGMYSGIATFIGRDVSLKSAK